MTFHLTQAFSGHGCFPAYLKRFGLLPTEECWFCDGDKDDAMHTLFECEELQTQRAAMEGKIRVVTPDTIVG